MNSTVGERWIPFVCKIALYLWLVYFFLQAATAFHEYTPGRAWPFMLSVIRTFTFLPLHEGGHFLFMFFGRTLHILGGSFWQIMFPLLWFVIAARQRSHVAPFPLFWVGENMMDVSLYMRDAPLRWLPLLGGHSSQHDWYNLFSQWNLLDSSDTFADLFYYGGSLLALGAIVAGIGLAFVSFLNSPPPRSPKGIAEPSSAMEDSLDLTIRGKDSPF